MKIPDQKFLLHIYIHTKPQRLLSHLISSLLLTSPRYAHPFRGYLSESILMLTLCLQIQLYLLILLFLYLLYSGLYDWTYLMIVSVFIVTELEEARLEPSLSSPIIWKILICKFLDQSPPHDLMNEGRKRTRSIHFFHNFNHNFN